MNKTEAERIATIVNLERPTWSKPLIMAVLGDEKMIRRPYLDALIALLVCANDDTTEKPGRVHERGHWWQAVEALRGSSAPNYRAVLPTDCGICSRPFEHHSALSKLDDHEYEPLADRKPGVGPTAEQKAAIQAAAIEAQKVRPEPAPKRPPRDPADVIAEHTSTPEEQAL